jgi:hypothetical protein
MALSSVRIGLREIGTADIEGIVNLLASGFRNDRNHWVRTLTRLTEHPTPAGFPKYGYLLECEGAPVGVILLIFSAILVNGETKIRCNVCSWHVKPGFNSYAAMLASRALSRKDVTYVNVAPAPHTLPILKAQGYEKYCGGWFAAVPSLFARSNGAHVSVVAPGINPDEHLQPGEIELLLAHAKYGCISLICESGSGRYPFVFMRRRFGVVPFVYLAYCRDIKDFVRFAGPLGRFLAGRGVVLIALDSSARIRGLIGAYFDRYPKYFKGPDQPRLGDLAYSELVMFRFAGGKIWRDRRRNFLLPDVTGED